MRCLVLSGTTIASDSRVTQSERTRTEKIAPKERSESPTREPRLKPPEEVTALFLSLNGISEE
ncbi:MAG: hypothetical protein J07HQW1_02848 [Haloquadratum walsbyi J07HQW1]|jgi:hypothetical protein|uniref:Uncharacterized protein n=1 Tax=Haloquadratum walsbyi J07HQW1 TaxID=1238424 RepID=U1N7X4_9EURY|nr:MAG: hypothetical protein J07HQW1_02848 [Haloquadratum walsbyi J07HQW1]